MTHTDINNRPRLSGFANDLGIRKISGARRIQRPGDRYTGCPNCGRALSIAEVIERHCENCGRQTHPEEMRRTTILPAPLPATRSDSRTPP
nr:endonuclease Q family protein [Rhizobium sp. M1]